LFAFSKGQQKLIRAWDADPEQAVQVPLPPRISREQYDRALVEYRKNLYRMARAAKAKGVPIIFCTMTSNLRDWPPELSAFPPGFPDDRRASALESLERARLLVEEGHYQEAVDYLNSARSDFPGYAPLAFYLGRARSGLLFDDLMASDPESGVSAPELPDPQAVRAQAFADLRQAISEESRAVFSHRAPPELKRIVKEMAADQGALLLDVERAIETATYLPPGFDWFEDHCHPNLMGQQVIAEAIADFMKAHGLPRPAAEWEEPSPWDEPAFQAGRAGHGRGLFPPSLSPAGHFPRTQETFPGPVRSHPPRF